MHSSAVVRVVSVDPHVLQKAAEQGYPTISTADELERDFQDSQSLEEIVRTYGGLKFTIQMRRPGLSQAKDMVNVEFDLTSLEHLGMHTRVILEYGTHFTYKEGIALRDALARGE